MSLIHSFYVLISIALSLSVSNFPCVEDFFLSIVVCSNLEQLRISSQLIFIKIHYNFTYAAK
uniref:Uncharacterized protein n=1 Tax=Nelumbo nucifera TaxID=4432 RepID=A0A822XS01_NELNU|nr:TPA_asm: hypothetical protein HUJ06_024580 [Nelumbo nucifera]